MVTLNFQPDAITPSLTLAACYPSSGQTARLCLAQSVLHLCCTRPSLQQFARAKESITIGLCSTCTALPIICLALASAMLAPSLGFAQG